MKESADDLRWLTQCPASDQNFQAAVRRASFDTLLAAMRDLNLTLSARNKIAARIRKLMFGEPKKRA